MKLQVLRSECVDDGEVAEERVAQAVGGRHRHH